MSRTTLVVIVLSGGALAAAGAASKTVEFVDVTTTARLDWAITSLTTGADHFVETMGGGGGFVDYDGDGWLDVYFVAYSAVDDPGRGRTTRDALYRNRGDGTFTDVSAAAGIGGAPYGMGLAAGDYDNDGRVDLYRTGYGRSRLLHNRGGRFEDVTEASGASSPLWGTSAAFFDADADGWLDIWVANYVEYQLSSSDKCLPVGHRLFCRPASLDGQPSRLFRNERGERFTNVSASAGLDRHRGKGLGVVALDYDGDSRLDVFQANDATPNFLFRNKGGLAFEEVALEAGVAYSPEGIARGGMGVDAEDVFGTGRPDIFVANFTHETNAYFRNEGGGSFSEATQALGLAAQSLTLSGFGARFLDYDNDGRLDLFVLNGHPLDTIDRLYPNIQYEEPPSLFENTGTGFREVARERGEPLRRRYPGRGLATGDYDNDGDTDLLLLSVGARPALLRNDGGNRRHWLGVALEGSKLARDAVGARVTVVAGSAKRTRTLVGGAGYCTASDRRLLFGLGDARRVTRLEVEWPGGGRTVLENLPVDRYLRVRE